MRTSMNGLRRRTAILTALIVLFVVLGSLEQPIIVSAQVKKTTVTLALTPANAIIDPTVDQGSAVFTGTVTVKGIPLIVTSVNITANAGDWTNDTNPQSLVITGSKSGTFSLTVYAPYNATAGQTQDVKVVIKWSNTLNEKGTAESQAIATVNQSYSLNVYMSPSIIYFKGGKTSSPSPKAYISNSGNGEDSFSVALINNSDLLSAGWSFSFSKTTLNLGPDSQDYVQLTVSVPANAPVKVYKVQVRATSQGASSVGKSIFDDANLTVSVQSTGGGGGGGTNNTKKNNTNPVCTWGIIPLVLFPLSVTYCGVRTAQGRRTKRGKWE
jgi:hypothetical protein